jgi:hypothetical protein
MRQQMGIAGKREANGKRCTSNKMKISFANTLGIIAVVCSAIASAGQVSAKSWHTYCNARFGQCADIPPNFEADPPPENGDGLVFRDAGGMSITVSGHYNVDSSTLRAERDETVSAKEHVPTYQAEGASWFAVSGNEGINIYYIQKIATPDIIATLWIEYPSAQKEIYGPLIARISKSLKVLPVHIR